MEAKQILHSSLCVFGKKILPALLIVLVAIMSFVLAPRLFVQAKDAANKKAVNLNCSLVVPPQPLSAQGLATPYQLVATDPGQGRCHESNRLQSVFVQAAVIDPAGHISVYSPLVIDKGTQPAVAPVVPQLPPGGTVAIWFGANGMTLTLKNNGTSLQDGQCVNGVDGSDFGQVAYCNAPAFFQIANAAIMSGTLMPPTLGQGKDGMTCPTVRNFGVVDQDQSDNVTTSYLATNTGQIAQATPANMKMLPNAKVITNGSDNGLLDAFIDPALGCQPWTAPDLASPGQMATSLPLDEIQAGFVTGTLVGMSITSTGGQVALVPSDDPMVLDNNMQPDLAKLNAYRAGVDQPPVYDTAQSSTQAYCMSLRAIAPMRLQTDQTIFQNVQSPDPKVGSNLFTFMAQRFVTSYGPDGLNCKKLLGMPDPVRVQFNGKIAVSATINLNDNQQQDNKQQDNQQQDNQQQDNKQQDNQQQDNQQQDNKQQDNQQKNNNNDSNSHKRHHKHKH